VVSVFNSWSAKLADFTILPQQGIWSNLASSKPWLFLHLPNFIEKNLKKPEPQEGIDRSPTFDFDKEKAEDGAMNDAYAAGSPVPDLQALAKQHEEDLIRKIPDAAALARQLALAIKRAAHDMTLEKPREYTYEEWVEFTRLIRFSAVGGQAEAFKDEEDEGLIQWDWLAENSPMMAQQNESEFVLERLCESLVRYLRRNPPHAAFSGTLREQGEEALRLKTKTWHDDKPEPEPDSFDPKSRRGSVIAKPSADADNAQAGGLHILHEVEDEHHSHDITPVK
jgi:potassium channel subfamily K